MKAILEYSSGYKYQVRRDFIIHLPFAPATHIRTDFLNFSTDGTLRVNAGYAWNGASGPTIDTKSSQIASLVHDALYQLIRLGLLDTSYKNLADDIFYKLCLTGGMCRARAKLWYNAVKYFGHGSTKVSAEPPIKRVAL